MSTFKLEIALGNVAMRTPGDVSMALGKVRLQLSVGAVDGRIFDGNGNTVGKWELRRDDQLNFEDEHLRARVTDPVESHKAGAAVEKREGSVHSFNPNTQKHRILAVYANATEPLTDREAWTHAGIGSVSGAWHRCSDLLKAEAIKHVDTVTDPVSKKEVRRCIITPHGQWIAGELRAGRRVRRKP
jgi:hypothetical protein